MMVSLKIQQDLIMYQLIVGYRAIKSLVQTGYTGKFQCAYITAIFTVKYVYSDYEMYDHDYIHENIQYMYSLTKSKQYMMSQNVTLDRISTDHSCSRCVLHNSSTKCAFTSKVIPPIEPAFFELNNINKCPYLVLSREEHDSLKLRNIIPSDAHFTRRSNEYLVCINDTKFDVLTQMGTRSLTEHSLLFWCFMFSSLSSMLSLV